MQRQGQSVGRLVGPTHLPKPLTPAGEVKAAPGFRFTRPRRLIFPKLEVLRPVSVELGLHVDSVCVSLLLCLHFIVLEQFVLVTDGDSQ